MLTKITIENFKGIHDRIEIELKPLTLLFGANSGGKSTILHALHYAREIFEHLNADADRTISGGDFVDLGGFAHFVHGHDLGKTVWLRFDLADDRNLDLALCENLDMYEVTRHLRTDRFPRFPGSIDSFAWGTDGGSVEVGIRWDLSNNRPYIACYRLYLMSTLFAEVTSDPLPPRVQLSRLDLDHTSLTPIADYLSGTDGEPDLATLEELYADPYETCLSACWRNASEWFQRVEGSPPAASQGRFVPILLEEQPCALPEPGKAIKIELRKSRSGEQSGHDRTHFGLAREVAADVSRILTAPIDIVRDYLRQFHYLGPLRETPPRDYAPPRFRDDSRWSSGLGAWDMLHTCDKSLLQETSRWLADPERLDAGCRLQRNEYKEVDLHNSPAADFLAGRASAETAEDLRLRLTALPTQERLVIRPNDSDVELGPHDVGIGISQVVPVVITALADQNRLLAIEQPELHLHPRLQANLGDLFIEAGLGGPKHTVILETHSEHLILRILRRIRETSKGQPHEGRKITPDDVAVYYLGRQDGQTKLTRIDIDMNGEFVQPWPDDFFELDFYERFS